LEALGGNADWNKHQQVKREDTLEITGGPSGDIDDQRLLARTKSEHNFSDVSGVPGDQNTGGNSTGQAQTVQTAKKG
jgi:hypothetical protein